jgi:hypothetical protein
MRTIDVSRMIPAPPEPIFDLLADHANYGRFRGIDGSKLLREGDPPPNGVGAMRRVKVRPLSFDEEITFFERPSALDYLIVRLNVPFDQRGASIRLTPADGGTRVDWRSSYSVPTPLIGGLQERLWEIALARGFRRVLEDVERLT